MTEIERKFLVNSTDFVKKAYQKISLRQGYLSKDPERTVRIRVLDQKGFLTVKGKSSTSGMSRFEWEKEIDKVAAEQLLELALPGIIEKDRYLVNEHNHCFEVDVFYGNHHGLIIAEIEVENEDEKIILPKWIGREVTGEKEYYNSFLSSTEEKNSLNDS